jgi:hypothetical protein
MLLYPCNLGRAHWYPLYGIKRAVKFMLGFEDLSISALSHNLKFCKLSDIAVRLKMRIASQL